MGVGTKGHLCGVTPHRLPWGYGANHKNSHKGDTNTYVFIRENV